MLADRSLRVRRRAFTLIELLVVIGIIGCLMGLILPALEHAREQANNVRCASNLSQIGSALLRYANENHGNFPRTRYDPAAPLCTGTNPAATDPFAAGGPLPNDTTAPLFLLARTQGIPLLMFIEPYNDEIETSPDPATDVTIRSNFTNAEANLGYSYANPYPSVAAANNGYKLAIQINPAFVLAGDRNPGTGPGKNSRNHEGRGQNVLFADFHVLWETSTNVGQNGDEIYVNQAGAAIGSPLNSSDSVLLPTDK